MIQMNAAAAAVTCFFLTVTASAADERGWVEKSDENAEIVLELLAEFNPEAAASLGVDGFDEAIIDYRPGLYERNRSASAYSAGGRRKSSRARGTSSMRTQSL